MAGDYDYYFKVVIIGESGVGKSCLQLRYKDDSFSENYIATIGVEFLCKIIPLDGKLVKVVLWDTAGQERFRAITTSFYRGTSGIIIVYDVTDQKSFDRIHEWVEGADRWTNKDVSKLLIGNKCDLAGKRVVDYNTAKDYANQLGIPYIETSAKDAANVEKAFVMIAADMKEKADPSKEVNHKDQVKLNSTVKEQNKLCC